MCTFQSFFFSDEGYVVKCKECGHYQVAFLCLMVTLTSNDFQAFRRIVKYKSDECLELSISCEYGRHIIIQTPVQGINFLLSPTEIRDFSRMLEEADNEEKTQAMLALFNTP